MSVPGSSVSRRSEMAVGTSAEGGGGTTPAGGRAVRSAPRPTASRNMQFGQRASAPKGVSTVPHFSHRRSVGMGQSVSLLLQQRRHEPYEQNASGRRKVMSQ